MTYSHQTWKWASAGLEVKPDANTVAVTWDDHTFGSGVTLSIEQARNLAGALLQAAALALTYRAP